MVFNYRIQLFVMKHHMAGQGYCMVSCATLELIIVTIKKFNSWFFSKTNIKEVKLTRIAPSCP